MGGHTKAPSFWVRMMPPIDWLRDADACHCYVCRPPPPPRRSQNPPPHRRYGPIVVFCHPMALLTANNSESQAINLNQSAEDQTQRGARIECFQGAKRSMNCVNDTIKLCCPPAVVRIVLMMRNKIINLVLSQYGCYRLGNEKRYVY